MAVDAMAAAPRSAGAPQASRLLIVLVPVSHPELDSIQIHENLFAIGRTESPFDSYPPELAGGLSRRHAHIFCEHGAVYFAELGSKNGSSVNGVPVKPGITALKDGDLLGLGKTLSYRVQFERAALEPAHARLGSLTLYPEQEGGGLQPIVVSEFPFLVSKADDSFARYRDSDPTQLNYLSRRHAHIFLKGGVLHVEDLGSTNGTFVNDARLDEHAQALQEGDVLAFGGRHFVYRVALAWEAAPRDPTLTRIGAVHAAPALDADRTTFVAAADSFLDIFCVDPASAAGDAPQAQQAPAAEALDAGDAGPPPRGRAAAMLSGLYAAFGGEEHQGRARLRRWGLAALGIAIVLGVALFGINRTERQVEGLLDDGAYAQAALVANAALTDDPGNGRLAALGTEALLKANLPGWMAQLKAGRFAPAAAQLVAMRRDARNNPELLPLLDELDWMLKLEAFVASRGGAQVPVRNAADGARIAQLLAQWEAQQEAHQRAFETIAAHVPAFRDAYADALSDVRRLALARSGS